MADSPEPTETGLEGSLNDLWAYCKKNDIEIQKKTLTYLDATAREITFLRLAVKTESGKKMFEVRKEKEASELLSFDFKNVFFLDNYRAYYSPDKKVLEAAITLINRNPLRSSPVRILSSLFKNDSEDNDSFSISCQKETSDTQIEIKLGKPLNETLLSFEYRLIHFPISYYEHTSSKASRVRLRPSFVECSIRIENLVLENVCKATKLLEEISNSVFFQIDCKTGFPFSLAKAQQERTIDLQTNAENAVLTFPQDNYGKEPSSFYWYARTSSDMPLQQYLAFYQAIECFYPTYVDARALRDVQTMMKNPVFNKHSENDVAGLIAAIRKLLPNVPSGNEASQLKITIDGSVCEEELKSFILADEGLKYAVSKKHHIHSLSPTYLLEEKNDTVEFVNNLKDQVGQRIYGIRCSIVHSKVEWKYETKTILPFSKEAAMLGPDIRLVSFVAKSVLIASSKPLKIQ